MNINKLWFPWKPAQFRLGTLSENACLSRPLLVCQISCFIKKCTIRLKFRVMPPDYFVLCTTGIKSSLAMIHQFESSHIAKASSKINVSFMQQEQNNPK